MFKSKYGPFNGGTWEDLCQQVFKKKFQVDGYQRIPASPGDFGLEGFTLKTGFGFQCYCPDKHYERKELYEKQRDKITADIGKLKTFQAELKNLLGDTKLTNWFFVTPEIDRNALLSHARSKEKEAKGWGLPFLADDFCILLHDGDDYLTEINEIRSAAGEALVFDDATPELAELTELKEVYEQNVHRKCEARLAPKKTSPRYTSHVHQLHTNTLSDFLEADGYFRKVSDSAPMVYVRLVRLINEYEKQVVTMAATWTDTAETLTDKIRDGLERRIVSDLSPEFDETSACRVARLMIARWLAICELDYDE